MKKIVMSFLVVAATAGVVSAQDTGNGATKSYAQTQDEWEKKLRDDLKLTPEQATKYDAVSKEFKTKMDALKQDATLTTEAMKEKKTTLKKEKETRLFEFLTPEQQTKYKEWMDKKKKEDGEKSGS